MDHGLLFAQKMTFNLACYTIQLKNLLMLIGMGFIQALLNLETMNGASTELAGMVKQTLNQDFWLNLHPVINKK